MSGPAFATTPRQTEILRLAAAGLTDKEVARRLGLRHGTVRKQFSFIFRRTGIPNRFALGIAWARTGAAAGAGTHWRTT